MDRRLGIDHLTGSIEIGKSADLVIIEENFKKFQSAIWYRCYKINNENKVVRVEE